MKKFYTVLILLVGCFCLTEAQTKDGLPLKLRVGTYNVGHFNQGKVGGYQGVDVQEEMERWRTWIGQQSMDVFFPIEWNGRFDKDSTMDATEILLKPFYNYIYFGDKRKYIYNGIAINTHLKNIRQVYLTHKEYYALIGDLKIGKKTITLMSVHIPWQECCHESSVDALIQEMKKYEYLICAGDMNAFDHNQRKFFDAGFNIANGGYEGWHCTAAAKCDKKKNVNIDNIITSKNIKITNVSAPHTGLSAQDHWPILADITIIW
jgi:endonuclease/exonuclease/phosphatase family metal-dependent hydrolase